MNWIYHDERLPSYRYGKVSLEIAFGELVGRRSNRRRCTVTYQIKHMQSTLAQF